jgi:hypothetical protein
VATSDNTGAMLVLAAGGITFATKFYYSHELDWKVVIATPLIAAGFAGLGKLDPKATMVLGVMALAGAATTKFNGHSFTDILIALGQRSSPAAATPAGDGGTTQPGAQNPSGDASGPGTPGNNGRAGVPNTVPVQVHQPGPG